VSPADIESVLSLHPAVAEVAVVGMPDERWGQRVTAFVKRAPDADVAVEPAALVPGAARRASPITSDRAIMCSSPRSRNRRSARSCGGFSWPVSIGGNEMTDPAPLLPALPDIFDGFRARERADVRQWPRLVSSGSGAFTLSRRERMVIVEPRGTGMALFTLRAAGEVRAPHFGSAEGDLDAEMVAIAGAIIRQRTGNFDPSTYHDRYQEALQQLISPRQPRPRNGARPGNFAFCLVSI
jgi:hypothetical protein